MKIRVEPSTPQRLEALGVDTWDRWECAPSTFDWHYDEDESAYVLEGHVKVRTADGEVEIKGGDIVHFPAGLSCTWEVVQTIRKVYAFNVNA